MTWCRVGGSSKAIFRKVYLVLLYKFHFHFKVENKEKKENRRANFISSVIGSPSLLVIAFTPPSSPPSHILTDVGDGNPFSLTHLLFQGVGGVTSEIYWPIGYFVSKYVIYGKNTTTTTKYQYFTTFCIYLSYTTFLPLLFHLLNKALYVVVITTATFLSQ